MFVRKAEKAEIDTIMKIYAHGKQIMDRIGNTKQWAGGGPTREMVLADIEASNCYLCIEDEEICGVFAFILGEDETYREIYDGAWLNDKAYGTIHRLASNEKAKGVFRCCINYCSTLCDNIRIDTHEDNTIMHHLLQKNGFSRVGIIYLASGDARVAYHRETKRAYFAGGCFWCVTPIFKIYGVDHVVSGYAGGKEENPSYEDVKHQKTGHRETILVVYQEKNVSYEKLLDIYLANVDPFDAEGQFIDRGFSYTLAIFYNDLIEKEKATQKMKELEEKENKKCAISLLPFTSFFSAEEEHQDYYLKNPEAFEEELISSGRKEAN